MSDNPYAAPQTEIRTQTASTRVSGKRPLATRWQRLGGYLIDYALLIVGLIVVMMPTGFVLGLVHPDYFFGEDPSPMAEIIEQGIALVVMSAVFLALNGYLLANRGQTIGKYILKTQIVSDKNELVPWPRIFLLRYLAFWFISMIPAVGGLLSLGDSLAIFRGNHKCWHDEIAGTKVVMLRAPAHYRELPDKIEIPEEP